MTRLSLLAAAATLAVAPLAGAQVVINEALVSTSGDDNEFIEIYNAGSAPVDLSDYAIRAYEGDSSSSSGQGTLDTELLFPANTILGAGEFFLFGNARFANAYNITPDAFFPFNGPDFDGTPGPDEAAFENGSQTIVLEDGAGANAYAVYLTDGDDGDFANEAGDQSVALDLTVGPDGTFLPAGYYLDTDGGSTASILEFSQPSNSATPGFTNVVPEPTGLALLGLGGLAALRRRR